VRQTDCIEALAAQAGRRIMSLMRNLTLGLVAAGAAATVQLAAMQAPPSVALAGEVRVAQGILAGVPGRNPAITVFKGVPFAAPPVGDLRWRPPQPAAAWEGRRVAADFSPSCIQEIADSRDPWTYEFLAHGDVSEDCLTLNIWTPARLTAERRPVFVYIHGGANREGSGAVPVYDGEGLASRGLVVVTINYRLGVFGFFAHPELTAESPENASGNYGLLDQIAALRWVRENIGSFGGDPDRITVAGQSAGASAVHNVTASPLARGLFHRAIAQSGSSLNTFRNRGRALSLAEADGVRFATAKAASTVAELRAMSAEEVFAPVQALVTGNGPTPDFRWGPVIDGYALPASIGETFAAGNQNDVPTLTGLNADEYGASPQPAATLASFTAQARERYGDRADAFLALYPARTDEEARAAANSSARDIARTSMYLWALERAKTARTPVYTYYWSHPLPGPDVGRYGAFHTSEVPYLFNSLSMSPRPFTALDHRIADLFSTLIVDFVTSGDPNGNGIPPWHPVSPDEPTTFEIGENVGPIPLTVSPEAFTFLRETLLDPEV
jgi:para-nitrobenzyl esterase